MIAPMIGQIGPWQIAIIVLLIVILFGARKLPEFARGAGQALRIFKAETKGLIEDDDKPEELPSSERTEPQKEPETKSSGTDAN